MINWIVISALLIDLCLSSSLALTSDLAIRNGQQSTVIDHVDNLINDEWVNGSWTTVQFLQDYPASKIFYYYAESKPIEASIEVEEVVGRKQLIVDVVDLHCPGDVFELQVQELRSTKSSLCRKREKHHTMTYHKWKPTEMVHTLITSSVTPDRCLTVTSDPDRAWMNPDLWSQGSLLLDPSKSYSIVIRTVSNPYGGGAMAIRGSIAEFVEEVELESKHQSRSKRKRRSKK